MIQIPKLPPFKRFCITIGAIPATYIESLSYYETLLWLCKYLQDTVIPAINTNAEAVTELQNAFEALQSYVNNYFENLDVQEEINTKLDEMVEDGSLQDIIVAYLQIAAVLGYDTVADMAASTNLIEGSICKTLGYSSYSDGMGAYYRIRTVTSGDTVDGVNIIALSNSETLIAEKIINLQSVIVTFNTVTEMKSNTTLNSGDIVKTIGYSSITDGGGAEYIVVDSEPSSYYEELQNDLYAKLIIKGSINVKSLGLDDQTDIALKLNELESMMSDDYSLYFPTGDYLISTTFETDHCKELYGDGYSSKITCDSLEDALIFGSTNISIHDIFLYNNIASNITDGKGITLNHAYQCKIDNVKVAGFKWNIYVKRHQYTTITNCNIEEWETNGIHFENANAPDSGDSCVSTCSFYPSSRSRSNTTAIEIKSGGGVRIINNKINWYTIGYQPVNGIVLQPSANVTTYDLFIEGNSIENCTTSGITIDVTASSSTYSHIIVNGNEIAGYNNAGKGIILNGNYSSGNDFTLNEINITNNIIAQFDTGIDYGNLNNLLLANNMYKSLNTCIYKSSTCNGVTIDEKTFVVNSNKLIYFGLYGADNREQPNGIFNITTQSACTTTSGNKYKLDMGSYSVMKGKITLKGIADGVGAVYQETDFIATYSNGNVNVTLTPVTAITTGSGFCAYTITESRDQSDHSITFGYSTDNTSLTGFNGTYVIEIYGYKPRKLYQL